MHICSICARRSRERSRGLATVFPGEKGAAGILEDAFENGLGGVKLHVHVQCFDMNSPAMEEVCEVCRVHEKPIVIHAGREPESEQYRCDPYEICKASKIEILLKSFSGLKLCVPHLGFGELHEYQTLVENYENLWLDTTMVLTDYFPIHPPVDLSTYRTDRIMYGSDFPNIPYAWDRELLHIRGLDLPGPNLRQLLSANARTFFNIPSA